MVLDNSLEATVAGKKIKLRKKKLKNCKGGGKGENTDNRFM